MTAEIYANLQDLRLESRLGTRVSCFATGPTSPSSLRRSRFLPDSTATAFDVRPGTRTFAGIFVTALPVEPQRTIMAVFKCKWQ
jgi:hypothetical protein